MEKATGKLQNVSLQIFNHKRLSTALESLKVMPGGRLEWKWGKTVRTLKTLRKVRQFSC